MPDCQQLADHASHRQANEMGLLDTKRLMQGIGVLSQQFETVGSLSHLGPTMAACIVAQDPIFFGQDRHLRVPHCVI